MVTMGMRVAFLAAECEPWAKTGGLADVVDALARALGRLGGDAIDGPVDVFLPRYRTVPEPEPSAILGETSLAVPDPRAPAGSSTLTIVDVAADGYRLRLVDHPPAFARAALYGDSAGDYADNAWRFGLYARAALEAVRTEGLPLDVLHLHDWQAGPAALFRDWLYGDDPIVGRAAIVMTLHNLAYHGWTPNRALAQLGLRPGDRAPGQNADGIDLIAAGIEEAEIVNTVSPGYAREALTPAFGMGLDGLLRSRGDRFIGILNGLDNAVWDPARDAVLAAPFARGDLAGKAACRADLLARNGMDPADDGPVIGMIGRLDPQKGFDLLADAAARLLAAGCRLVILGSGAPRIAADLRSLAERSPDRVALLERFDRAMARRIYAGVDFFLMPSRFEPCGLNQLYSLRYGTVPVVRATGGLQDTVRDPEEATPGTGFKFREYHPAALVAALHRALDTRRDVAQWTRMQQAGMREDHSWDASAREYVKVYKGMKNGRFANR